MAPRSHQHVQADTIGVRSPFDAYDTKDEMGRMVDEFLYRTGLLDYKYYIRIGAFLARRPFGEKQVERLRKAHQEEDNKERETSEPGSPNNSPSGRTDSKEHRERRREDEYEMLKREGNRGRWPIFWQQSWRVHALVLCCSLGAAIQGWDESAVNGAQLYYQNADNFNIAERPALLGTINSAPYLMCILSCCLTGPLNYYLGRKGTIMFCCLFSFASCLGQAFCQTWQQMLLCRLLLGLGIGPKSASVPIYAAESVPSEEIRGALVMSWQVWTAFGIMLGYGFTYAFRNLLVAPAILFFLMMSLPESPRWYLLKARRLERENCPGNRVTIEKQYEKAFYALRTLRHTKIQAARDLFYIDAWLRMEEPYKPSQSVPRTNWQTRRRTWFRNTVALARQPRCRRAMTAGLIVMLLQQLCGVNVFAYYSSSVFRDSLPTPSSQGIDGRDANNTALAYSLEFGAVNFVLAIPAALLIDKVGRRLLLLTTFPLMSVFSLATGISLGPALPIKNDRRQDAVVAFAYLFCVAYSVGEGPVPLVYASECLPLEVRDTGVGILTAVYWGLNSLMALTWPQMYEKWKPEGSFGFYALMNLIGWFLIIFYVPETSRYTLEQLHDVFSQSTSTIVKKGWAQVRWLITGKGEVETGGGRWNLSEYPVLVERSADRPLDDFEQEMEDRDRGQSVTEVTSSAVENPKTALATERLRNTRSVDV